MGNWETLTVADLRDALEDFDDDAKVNVAYQKNEAPARKVERNGHAYLRDGVLIVGYTG